MREGARACLAGLLIGGTALKAGAAGTPRPAAFPCPAQPVRVAFYEVGLFYAAGKGLDRDLIDALQARTGCRFEAGPVPRMRAYVLLEGGQTDIVMAAVPAPSRAAYAAYVPYLRQRFLTILGPGVPPAKRTLAGFMADPALRFGAVRGVTYGPGFDEAYQRLLDAGRVDLAPDQPTLFRMLRSQRFQALFSAPLQYEKELADNGMRGTAPVVDWFPAAPPVLRCLALSRRSFTPAQIAAWGAAVQALRDDGTLRRIVAKYMAPREVAAALP